MTSLEERIKRIQANSIPIDSEEGQKIIATLAIEDSEPFVLETRYKLNSPYMILQGNVGGLKRLVDILQRLIASNGGYAHLDKV